MSRVASLLVVGLLALCLPSSSQALWGQKARGCPRWEARLAQLEQGGEDPNSLRLRTLKKKLGTRCVAFNEIQVLGTHNSYHIAPQPALLSLLVAFDSAFSAFDYTHIPLDEQFSTEGIRQIELDVFADPTGGLYNLRRGLILIGQPADSGLPEMVQPGFKVLHVQDVDFQTTCTTFVGCLRTIKTWSDTHKGHLPITVLIEAKDDVIPDPVNLGFTIPIPIGTAEFDALDAEIRSVFPKKNLLVPDDLRHGRPTLEEAILTIGWPRLGSVRDKVIFLLDNAAKRDAYIAGHPSLEGRVLFTNASPGDPDAAFVEINDSSDPSLPGVVSAGYLVRTRADADTVEARVNDTGPRDAALASGAQFVSTDYPVPNPAFGTGYFVAIPGGMPARCNPVNAPPGCRADSLERLP
jgi:hypothetical protein